MASHDIRQVQAAEPRTRSVGPERAPHRSYYYAMGMTEERSPSPFVGVVTTWNEAAPCNIALGRQAQAVKRGVEGRRHAARVHHHHRHRRHRHGPRRA